jgi:hypothetical protein
MSNSSAPTAVKWRAMPGWQGAITRGLAVNDEHLLIGRSEPSGRHGRLVSDGGLWMVDRKTLVTVEQFRFPGRGCVNEIRLLDGTDECHNGEPFDGGLLAGLSRSRPAGAPSSRLS